MTIEELREILRSERLELERRGVASLAVFGSTARGEAEADSDIDLLVEFSHPPTLFDLGGLQVFLEELLGRPVDVTTAEMLRPEIKSRVLREAVRAA